MNIKPMSDRVVVELIEEENITSGGLFLPSTVTEKPQKGRVTAVGKGDEVHDIIQIGDIILFAKNSGIDIEGNIRVLYKREVIGVLK